MYYANAAISFLDKANDFYVSYQNVANNYINKPVYKIQLFLYENRYQVTNFLPRLSLAGIACTVSLIFISTLVVFEESGRGFASIYREIPDCAKNYLSFKTAKILTMGVIVATGPVIFYYPFVISTLGVAILGLSGLILSLEYDWYMNGKPKVDRTFEDPADPMCVEKLNLTLSYKNETAAIKLLSNLCEADIKGNFYRNENLLSRAVSLNMQELIRNLSKIDGFSKFQDEALKEAINDKNLETVKTLISCFKYSSFDTYFNRAYELAYSEIMQCFIDNGCKVDLQSYFFKASYERKLEQLTWLCGKVNLDAIDPEDGLTALHKVHGNEEIVTLLINKGAKQDIPSVRLKLTNYGWFIPRTTFSEMAIIDEIKGQYHDHNLCYDQILQNDDSKLLERILDSKLKRLTEIEFLIMAYESGAVSCVELLLKKGATLKVAFPDDETEDLILNAAKKGHTALVLSLAKTEKITLNVQDKEGCTPIHYAFENLLAKQKSLNNLLPLILAGADPTILNNKGLSCFDKPFHQFKIVNYLDVVTNFKFVEPIKQLKIHTYMLLKEALHLDDIFVIQNIFMIWNEVAKERELAVKRSLQMQAKAFKVTCYNHYLGQFKALTQVINQDAHGVLDIRNKVMINNITNPKLLLS